jgi:hypothetical protein
MTWKYKDTSIATRTSNYSHQNSAISTNLSVSLKPARGILADNFVAKIPDVWQAWTRPLWLDCSALETKWWKAWQMEGVGDKVEAVRAIPADECFNRLLISELYTWPLVPSVGQWVTHSVSLRNPLQGNKNYTKFARSRSQWSSGLRHELFSPAPTLRSWVRIPLRHGYLCVFCVCFFCFYIVWSETASRPNKRLMRTYHWISLFMSYIKSAN